MQGSRSEQAMRGWDPVGVKGGRADGKEEEGEGRGVETSGKKFPLKTGTLWGLLIFLPPLLGSPPGDPSHTPQPPRPHPLPSGRGGVLRMGATPATLFRVPAEPRTLEGFGESMT